MRIIKLLLATVILQFAISCKSKSQPEPALSGNWKITSAVGNNDLHWTGSFKLKKQNNEYRGLFIWNSVGGEQTGTDSVAGKYDTKTKKITLASVAITGNIEAVTYTADVSGNGTIMKGIWTGSSDGTIEHPGHWEAEKQ